MSLNEKMNWDKRERFWVKESKFVMSNIVYNKIKLIAFNWRLKTWLEVIWFFNVVRERVANLHEFRNIGRY